MEKEGLAEILILDEMSNRANRLVRISESSVDIDLHEEEEEESYGENSNDYKVNIWYWHDHVCRTFHLLSTETRKYTKYTMKRLRDHAPQLSVYSPVFFCYDSTKTGNSGMYSMILCKFVVMVTLLLHPVTSNFDC